MVSLIQTLAVAEYLNFRHAAKFMAAWATRWRMNGAGPDEVQSKMNKILAGAEPPRSEKAVISLLSDAGFEEPVRFFASLFWAAWLARRIPTAK